MSEIVRLIERLRATLDGHVTIDIALVDIAAQLETLRRLFKTRASEFSQANIEELRRVRSVVSHLGEMSLWLEDAKDCKSREFALEIADELAGIAQSLQGMKLGMVAQTAASNLRARSAGLPSEAASLAAQAERRKQAERVHQFRASAEAFQTIANQAPLCPKCGIRLVLRGGRFGDFWGCTAYPVCDGTSRLGATALNDLQYFRDHHEIRYDEGSVF
jgi:hypothetical protein